MLVLGIEGTAHTFGIGIVDCKRKEVLFNEKSLFQDEENGMDPRKLLEFHVANFDSVLKSALDFLKTKKKTFEDLDLIAFSQGPGQGPSLKVAALVAKTLALEYQISIVGVNHIKSHLEIGKFATGFSDPIFLNITGVNSQVIATDDLGIYRVYGETEDVGLGNIFDYCARLFGLGFPGGPQIEVLARKGKHFIELPYTIKGMNVSLAGLKSHIKQKLEKFEKTLEEKRKVESDSITYTNRDDFINDLCYSLQETVFAMLMEIAERALAYTNKKELAIVGGVAANKRFVKMAKEMCTIRGVKYAATPLSLCMDNGAMIAWAGFVKKDKAQKNLENLKPMPYITVESEL